MSKNNENGVDFSISLGKKSAADSRGNLRSVKASASKSFSRPKSTNSQSLANLSDINLTDLKLGNLSTQGPKSIGPANYSEVGALQLLGPVVAIGVNLIEAGPLAGQYLITIGTDRKDTVVPVGYAFTAMQAAQVYDMVILAIYGHHAILNFPASSYQLKTLGSLILSLPHLFTPHMFWKGMATAEAAGVKNDLAFNGMQSVFPCSSFEAEPEDSEFCSAFGQLQRCNPFRPGMLQLENQNHMWKLAQVAHINSKGTMNKVRNGDGRKCSCGAGESRVIEDLGGSSWRNL